MASPDVAGGKILIFSEAEVTVDYLYRELNPGDADPTIARLSGSTRGSIEQVVKRFSPTWNLGTNERLAGPEVRILIATDVVSEGMNLQDCARVLNYDLHWNPVRLVQRFGRIDRIGTTHEVIDLHNMWPDLELDEELDLTERLLARIQVFHDFIGLDSRLLSDRERLNERAMYRIYEQRQMPELDEGFDEVATQQRGAAILQRIQSDDPDLWRTITELPDGIRSAITVARAAAADAEAQRFAQAVLEIHGAQMPMMSPGQQAGAASPFGAPQPGETIVLLSSDDVTEAYAVGSDLNVRAISPAQFIAAAECGPDTPTAPLPADTNERVMAAFEAFRDQLALRLGRARRPGGDTRTRRYLTKHLSIWREQHKDDADEAVRTDTLRRVFLGQALPQRVLSQLDSIRGMGLEDDGFVRRLESLRFTFRLSLPADEADDSFDPATRVIRVVCSDGLVA